MKLTLAAQNTVVLQRLRVIAMASDLNPTVGILRSTAVRDQGTMSGIGQVCYRP
jgi:hypothetical protein